MDAANSEAFDNVKDQIGFCGIWCGSCAAGNGALRELTRRYEETTEAYGLSGWAPRDFEYDEFAKGLASIRRMPLCQGCLKGGGRERCEIRACAMGRSLTDCTECEAGSECEHGKILEEMRSGALAAGLMVRTDRADREERLEGWMAELASRWPSRLLFTNER